LCSQAGIPPKAASKKFLDAYKKRFNIDPILYAPFTYDAANLLIEAMRSRLGRPGEISAVLQKIDFAGATGRISFDEKGDRKDAEMTIFTMKGGSSADRHHQSGKDHQVRRFPCAIHGARSRCRQEVSAL